MWLLPFDQIGRLVWEKLSYLEIQMVVSKFGDYRNSDGISSEGKSSDYFKKKISVSANSVSIFWALKYIESKLSD